MDIDKEMDEFYQRVEPPHIPRHAAREIATEAYRKGYAAGVTKAAGLAGHITRNWVKKHHAPLLE